MTLILTGKKGSGKTTLIRKIISESRTTVQGFLSVKEMGEGGITGISLLILPEYELVPMASTTPMETDVFTGRFYFYPGAFKRVNRRFRTLRPGLPFIFDEFGLLEREQKGHYPVFTALLSSRHPALIVVRDELAYDLATFFGGTSQYRMIRMGSADRDEIGGQVAAYLKNRCCGD